jgi:uncharacterized membrane protein YsdA (DUF1294 family)
VGNLQHSKLCDYVRSCCFFLSKPVCVFLTLIWISCSSRNQKFGGADECKRQFALSVGLFGVLLRAQHFGHDASKKSFSFLVSFSLTACFVQLPIDDSSLVYGRSELSNVQNFTFENCCIFCSSDAGKTTHFSDEESLRVCKELGNKLNLRGHRPAKNAQDVSV